MINTLINTGVLHLWIKDGFHSYMKEDSKSLAQVGMLTEIKDVDNLKILIEEVRLDQDMKSQVLCVCHFMWTWV